MIRRQVQLTSDQDRLLRSLATERRVSVARLIREGVEKILEEAHRRERWRRLWEILDSCRHHDIEGRTDVAERHDHYLAEDRGRDERLR